MTEEWKPIPGFEGIYEVSNTGKIRTCEGKTTESIRHGTRHWKQREIKQKWNKNANGRSDARVTLYKDKTAYSFLVARLVAMAWCDGYDNSLTVDHKDCNSRNNNADNLQWVTLSDNIKLAHKNGVYVYHKCCLIGEDGVEMHFDSFFDASRYLGRNEGYISCLINQKRKDIAKDINGNKYKVVAYKNHTERS